MKVNISGRSYEFRDDIQHYIQKRAKKLSRHTPNSLSLSVTMKRQKNSYTALVNHTTKRKIFHANAVSNHPTSALNQAMEKIESQIRRNKGRKKTIFKDVRYQIKYRSTNSKRLRREILKYSQSLNEEGKQKKN